jgi:hypothetical protein
MKDGASVATTPYRIIHVYIHQNRSNGMDQSAARKDIKPAWKQAAEKGSEAIINYGQNRKVISTLRKMMQGSLDQEGGMHKDFVMCLIEERMEWEGHNRLDRSPRI